MRIAVVHKPYFFPWMGYFSRLSHANVFIVQDNVLASNRVWVNRSKIIHSNGQPGYITLPIGQKGNIPIREITLTAAIREKSARRIAMSIEHAYAKSRFFEEWKPMKNQFLDIMATHTRLLDIDMGIISIVRQLLRFPSLEVCFASSLKRGDDPIENLISNCHETRCDALLLGGGNTNWTDEDTARLRKAQIEPLIHDFYSAHPAYYQTRRERIGFYPGLSIIDCILNEGHEAAATLLKRVAPIHAKSL